MNTSEEILDWILEDDDEFFEKFLGSILSFCDGKRVEEEEPEGNQFQQRWNRDFSDIFKAVNCALDFSSIFKAVIVR